MSVPCQSQLGAVVKRNDGDVVIQVLLKGKFPSHLQPFYARLLQEAHKQYAEEPSLAQMKMFRVACKYLTLHPTGFRVDLSEVSQICSVDEAALRATLNYVELVVEEWKNIFAEEMVAFFLNIDKATRDDKVFVREFAKSLDFRSISETESFPLIHLIAATVDVFRNGKGLEVNPAHVLELSACECFGDYNRAYSIMISHYAKRIERKTVEAIVKPEWCSIEPGITPGTKVPEMKLLVDAIDPIQDYAEKLHSPFPTQALANDLYFYISAVRCFIGKQDINLKSIYLACLFIAELSHGTRILYREVAMIVGEQNDVLRVGIEEFESLFPRFRIFKNVFCENKDAIRAFALRLRFSEEQVIATQRFSSKISQMFETKYFVTRASVVLYIKGVEFGRPEVELRRVVPVITSASRDPFNKLLKDVYSALPSLKHVKMSAA